MRAISYAPPTAETSCVALSHVAQSQASLGMHTGLEHSRRAHSRSFSDAHTHTGNRVCMYWQTSQLCTVIKTQSAKCTHAEKRSVLTHLHTYTRINQYFPVGGFEQKARINTKSRLQFMALCCSFITQTAFGAYVCICDLLHGLCCISLEPGLKRQMKESKGWAMMTVISHTLLLLPTNTAFAACVCVWTHAKKEYVSKNSIWCSL